LLIDYRGILAELDTTIAKYQDLANRTQGGFDINDLEGLYSQMSTEYKKLPGLYDALWAIFKGVKNKGDFEQLRQVLVPKMQEVDGQMVDMHQKVRDDFYERLTEFASCLKVALQSATFYDDKSFSDADRRHYKETVKQMSSLRQLAKQDAGETIDYDEYAEQVRKLMDKHVVGVEVRDPKGVYEVGKMGQKVEPEQWSEEKTRNETDIIKTRVSKMIEQSLRDDPYAQEAFSKLLRQVIAEAEALFDHPLKQYMLFREFEEQVERRDLPEIPDRFGDNLHAQAYYGVFKKTLPEVFNIIQDETHEKWIAMSFEVDEVVTTAVAEHSINPQNIEAAIRKALLPMLFRECKSVGAGMDQAKAMVEMIVQITRVGIKA
ncbi:MAG: type I restriction endonuclease subunit R, partial [Thiohalomonadaceae bacterium]